MKLKPIERMLLKSTRQANGCVIYGGQLDKDGYGRVGSGEGATHIRAHRLSYQHFKGPIPDGMFVCHRCDTRGCVNPDHLFLGNHLINNQDRELKGRGADVTGSNNAMSKLSAEQTHEIHKLYDEGMSMTNIAKLFGVGMQNVSLIVRGSHWVDSYTKFHGKPPVVRKPKARLTDAQVLEIQAATGSCANIAKLYGCSTAQVSRIKNGYRSGSRKLPGYVVQT